MVHLQIRQGGTDGQFRELIHEMTCDRKEVRIQPCGRACPWRHS